jgi:hypothetical protein
MHSRRDELTYIYILIVSALNLVLHILHLLLSLYIYWSLASR